MQRPYNVAINAANWPAVQRPGNALLAPLSAAALDRLLLDLREVSVAAGTVLFERAGSANEVYFPVTCVVSLTSAPLDGPSIDVALVGSEGCLVAAPTGMTRSVFNAVVQVPGRLLVAGAGDFGSICQENPQFRRRIEHWQSSLLFQSQQIAACNAIHDVEKRLCRCLLQFNDRTGFNMLPVTQEMLANMLGVQRTTVTLVAHRLKNKGILRQRRGRMEILNIAALEASACGCHQVITETHEAIMASVLEQTDGDTEPSTIVESPELS